MSDPSNGIPKIDPRHTCFQLEARPSPIHRWGIYAAERIPPRRKVIEYVGQKISRREARKRAERPLNYIFTLNSYWSVDGSAGGSGAEFINHSCEPNIRAVIIHGHILYMSKREIRAGEELTVDYHFEKDVDPVRCCCGASMCRGTINLK